MNHYSPTRISACLISLFVFVVAILVRAPSCYESLWIDELHSAWCIWGSFGEVSTRATAGHQMPTYFWFLWCWKQLVGSSEFALRMSSVLSIATASGLMTYVSATRFQSLLGGLTAGMILAIEQNSIFFGTELRPYGSVILASTIAVLCFLVLDQNATGSPSNNHKYWWGLIIAMVTGIALHPTSVGSMFAFPLILFASRKIKIRITGSLNSKIFRIALMILAMGSTSLLFLKTEVLESWDNRELWSSFGQSTSIREVWSAWNWIYLWVFPLIIAASALKIQGLKISYSQQKNLVSGLCCLAILCVAITVTYWLAAYPPIAPVWHRRYFIGLLPVFGAISGLAITLVDRSFRKNRPANIVSFAMLHPATLSGLILVALAWNQALIQNMKNYPFAYAKRGENWRDAIEYINQIANTDDAIWLAPGLIEEKRFREATNSAGKTATADHTSESETYLLFAVNGPYALNHEAHIWLNRFTKVDKPGRNILLARTAAHRLNPDFRRAHKVIAFGNLSVTIAEVPR
jgi:mannosyltransferase